MNRIIMHCDCNAFYASVAELVNPSLKNYPMVVGGDPNSRHGIVLAKNEKAKKLGIKTAQTIWSAKQKYPDLVIAPTYWSLYYRYNKLINEIFERYTDVVEHFGIDESFLDLTKSIHLFGDNPVKTAGDIKNIIKKETGLTVSIGVSYNKFLAKMGSDYKKPDAITNINKNNFRALLWNLPISNMYMVGRATEKILKSIYIETIGDIARTEKAFLAAKLGSIGSLIHEYSNGIDESVVIPYYSSEKAKSVGQGITFSRDLLTRRDIMVALDTLSDRVSTRLRNIGMRCRSIQLTIKSSDFKSITRQMTLLNPTSLQKEILRVSTEIIDKKWEKGRPVRMLTITGQNLIKEEDNSYQISLFESQIDSKNLDKREKLENAIDKIREKHGKKVVGFGSIIDNNIGLSWKYKD